MVNNIGAIKADRVDGMCDRVRALGTGRVLCKPDMIREAIDGVLNSTGSLLMSAPNIHAKPLANAFWYLVDWYGGSCYTGKRLDQLRNRTGSKCDLIVRQRRLDMTSADLHSILDAVALILRSSMQGAKLHWG